MSGKPCAKSAAWLNRRAPELKRPSTLLCVFVTLLNDRVSESLVFPLLPFLLASFTSSGTTLGLLAGSYALAQFIATPSSAPSVIALAAPGIATCVAGTVVGLGVFGLTLELPWPDGSLWPLLLLFGGRLLDGFSGAQQPPQVRCWLTSAPQKTGPKPLV